MIDADFFSKNGFVVAKSVFARGEIDDLRHRLTTARARANSEGATYSIGSSEKVSIVRGDLLGQLELADVAYLVLDERLVSCVKALIGFKVIYFGDSSFQTGEGLRGFHKDNAHRTDGNGSDWQSEYNVIRVGIYLQDHVVHSGGLKVREKSHRYLSKHRGSALNVSLATGDVAFWKLTVSHSGNNVRIRGLPNLCLHPRIESMVPQWLRVPEERERIAAFSSFGAPGIHLDTYIRYLSAREDFREHFRWSYFPSRAMKLASEIGVELQFPTADFGARYMHRESRHAGEVIGTTTPEGVRLT